MSNISADLSAPVDLKPSRLVGETLRTEGLGLDPELRIVRAYTMPRSVNARRGRKLIRLWADPIDEETE